MQLHESKSPKTRQKNVLCIEITSLQILLFGLFPYLQTVSFDLIVGAYICLHTLLAQLLLGHPLYELVINQNWRA